MNWESWTGCYKNSDGYTYCYFHGVAPVTVGGETGRAARECDSDWVLNIWEQIV